MGIDNDDRRDARRSSRLRSALDVGASLMAIAASTVVISLTLSKWHEPTADAPTITPAEPAPPDTPQSLEGAQLIGSANAPIAVIEYSDFQCAFCARFSKNTWPLIKREYVDTGKVLTAFRHLALEGNSKSAAVSAECAAQQGKFWEMHDGLFQLDGTLDTSTGPSLARRLGLDMAAFERCSKETVLAKIDNNERIARSLRLSGTPTFLIGRVTPDRTVAVSRVLLGDYSFDTFKEIFDQLLTQREGHLGVRPVSR